MRNNLFKVFSRPSSWAATLPIKPVNNVLIQKVVSALLFRAELSMLDELPHSDRCDSKDFGSLFGCNQAHPRGLLLLGIRRVNPSPLIW
jgi:hypothetical protein